MSRAPSNARGQPSKLVILIASAANGKARRPGSDDDHLVPDDRGSCKSHGNDVPLGTDPPGLGSLGPRVADPRFSLGILEDELKMVSVRLEQLSSPISLAHDPEATKLT
jgi:hypothetical protein